MKLLLITCIEEFEKEVKKILNHSGVKAFTFQSVQGYKNNSENELHNWFSSDQTAIDSLLFTVFIQEECLQEIIRGINTFNAKQTTLSKIHLASFNIEKSI
ncbi:hypothetical protein [Daejeonia sp. YH14]|uniref:hypothetical protein n=1 Tax=Daejeonia sp. YH14 TaxID=3439042 RepID=UPI003F49B0A0